MAAAADDDGTDLLERLLVAAEPRGAGTSAAAFDEALQGLLDPLRVQLLPSLDGHRLVPVVGLREVEAEEPRLDRGQRDRPLGGYHRGARTDVGDPGGQACHGGRLEDVARRQRMAEAPGPADEVDRGDGVAAEGEEVVVHVHGVPAE